MSNLMRKTLSTLKNEGVVSLTNKTYNYIKYRVTNKYRYYYNDILIINGCTLPHPQRYRVDHQVEQLLASGVATDRINYTDLTMDKLKYYRGFIFYRCPITPTIEEFITTAKKENKTVFFDIDDLVIDKKYTKTIKYLETMSKEEKNL